VQPLDNAEHQQRQGHNCQFQDQQISSPLAGMVPRKPFSANARSGSAERRML
jgi:hypothetical protein